MKTTGTFRQKTLRIHTRKHAGTQTEKESLKLLKMLKIHIYLIYFNRMKERVHILHKPH